MLIVFLISSLVGLVDRGGLLSRMLPNSECGNKIINLRAVCDTHTVPIRKLGRKFAKKAQTPTADLVGCKTIRR